MFKEENIRMMDIEAENIQHKEWLDQQYREQIWLFMRRGWLDKVMDLLEKASALWFSMKETPLLESKSSAKGTQTLLHAWAEAQEHVNDQKFLDMWFKKFGDLNGDAVFKSEDERMSYHRQGRADNVVRIAVYNRKFGKANKLLKMGCPWDDAHADIFCEVSGRDHIRQDSMDLAMKMLDFENVAEWINNPIMGRGHLNKTALAVIVDSEKKEMDGIINKMVEKGADINVKMHGGMTILHMVMGRMGPDAYKLLAKKLVKLGADLSIKDDNGKTPIGALQDRLSYSKYTEKDRVEAQKEWLEIMTKQQMNVKKIPKKVSKAL